MTVCFSHRGAHMGAEMAHLKMYKNKQKTNRLLRILVSFSIIFNPFRLKVWCQIVWSIITGLPRATQTVRRISLFGSILKCPTENPSIRIAFSCQVYNYRFTKKNSENLKTEMVVLVTTAEQEDVQPKLFVDLRVAWENTRFSSLFAASPATKSEEKRMFSPANLLVVLIIMLKK